MTDRIASHFVADKLASSATFLISRHYDTLTYFLVQIRLPLKHCAGRTSIYNRCARQFQFTQGTPFAVIVILKHSGFLPTILLELKEVLFTCAATVSVVQQAQQHTPILVVQRSIFKMATIAIKNPHARFLFVDVHTAGLCRIEQFAFRFEIETRPGNSLARRIFKCGKHAVAPLLHLFRNRHEQGIGYRVRSRRTGNARVPGTGIDRIHRTRGHRFCRTRRPCLRDRLSQNSMSPLALQMCKYGLKSILMICL